MRLGRYEVWGAIGRGGMAEVRLARMTGPSGFARVVAVKVLHERFAKEPDFVAMLLDEARLASRVRHPSVVTITDVVQEEGRVGLVMDYVAGEPLSRVIPAAQAHGGVPVDVAVSIAVGVLRGLHAAHEAKAEFGAPLGMIHRDVSPPNVLVGADGLARVLDFGVAKADQKQHVTREGELKGKLGYMPREQLFHEPMDRRADVFAASVVLWETLVGKRLFADAKPPATASRTHGVEPPSTLAPRVPAAVDRVVMRGMAEHAKDRFDTAEEMARALEAALQPASQGRVAAWLESVAGASLRERAEMVARVDATSPERGEEPPHRTQDAPLGARPARGARALVTDEANTIVDASPPDMTVVPPTEKEASPRARNVPVTVPDAPLVALARQHEPEDDAPIAIPTRSPWPALLLVVAAISISVAAALFVRGR